MPIPPLSRGSPRQAPAPALRGPGRFGSLRLPSRMEEAARRGGRAVEGARLESVYTGNRIAGSNPAPSATISYCFHWCFYLLGWIRTGAEFPRLCGGRIARRGRQRPLSDRRSAATAALISVRDCCSTAHEMMPAVPRCPAAMRISRRETADLAMNSQCGSRTPVPAQPGSWRIQAKPSLRRCSGQASGRREWASSFCAVRSRGWRPSRIARVMSGAR